MARDALTITALTVNTFIEPPAALVGVLANGIKVTPSGDDDVLIVEVENTGASPLDVTVQTAASVFGIPTQDIVVEVTNGERRKIRLHPMSLYAQADGDIYIDVEANTDLSFWAFR